MSILTRRDMRDPFPLSSMLDRFFAEPMLTPDAIIPRLEEGTLAVDVSEDDKNVIVRASLPGFRKEDIEIETHDNVLSIKAQHVEEKEETGERFYRKERRAGSMNRRIALPSAVIEKEAVAELKDGVLTLRMPKVLKEQPKKIKIS